MPRQHGSPDIAGPLDKETEQIKRPKKRGSGTRRTTSRYHLHPPEIASHELPAPTAHPSAPTPEPLSTPALSRPTSTSGTPASPASPASGTLGTPPVTAATLPRNTSSTPTSASASSAAAPLGLSLNNPPKPGAESSPPGGVITVGGIDFHHASEAEFARLLNYYGIEWLYEPNQFPLQWRDGRPIEMFSPDFYLVEYDLYIELTTMRQSLVRRKNRKLRLLRALYPEINIKLLYRRDYQRLLERFGIRAEEVEAERPATVEMPVGETER
jgi:hypothetical protein